MSSWSPPDQGQFLSGIEVEQIFENQKLQRKCT